MNSSICLDQIRLIIFDLDFTILNSEHILGERTKDVLKACQDQQIMVTFATGKNWDAAQEIADALQINHPIVLANGALIKTRQGEIMEKTLLPWPALRHIIEICEKSHHDLVVYLDDDVYIKTMTDNLELLQSLGSLDMREVGDWQTMWARLPQAHKCMVVDCQSRQHLFDLEAQLRKNLENSIEFCQTLPAIMDMTAKGVSKGNALLRLCAYLGVEPGQVLAFGDGNNDAGMLSIAGMGIAVANASTHIKAIADVLVPSNEREGPAQFLDYLLKNRSAA